MIQISKYISFSRFFLFLHMENIVFAFFFCHNSGIKINKTLFNVYKNISFIDECRNLFDSEKNIFFLKFYFLWSKNYKHNQRLLFEKNPTIKLNKNLSNIFSDVWLKVFQFCNNFLFNFFINDMKMLVLDSNHKNFFYFLTNQFNNTQYNTTYISDNIDYFFPNPKNFSRWNWYMYFEIFCETHNISAFFVSDTVLINKNVSRISSLGLPIIAFLTHNKDVIVDYSFFFRVQGNTYYYMLAGLFINYTFFISLNYRLRCFKFIYNKNWSIVVKTLSDSAFKK